MMKSTLDKIKKSLFFNNYQVSKLTKCEPGGGVKILHIN